MSDSDSDWDVDEDEVQADASPVVVTPAAATSASPVAAAAASPTAAAASPSSAPPSVLLALPIQLSLKDHPALAAGIPAGITLLYDSAKNVITLLAYDQHKRPMLLEPLDGTKLLKSTLPFSFIMGDGDSAGPLGSATLLDSQSRKWTTTFASPAECARFAACLAVATLVAKAAAGTPVSALVIKHDLARGAGKSCKEKLFVTLAVRAWIVVLSTDSTRRGLEALTRVTGSTTLTQFNPQLLGGAAAAAAAQVPPSALVIDTTISDVEVAEDSAASSGAAPTSLGEALSGGKLRSEGGGRMLLLPCGSPLARELLAQHAAPTFAPEAGCLLVHLAPLSVSKKREKKEKKKEKEREKKSASAEAEEAAADDADSASDAPVLVSPSAASPAAASSSQSAFPSWSSEVSSSVGETLAALQAVNEQVGALPGLQQKLVKFLVNDLYEGLVEDLGLRPAVEAQAQGAEPDTTADGAAAVDATQAAHLAAVQGRIRGLVGAFTEQNSAAERKGTLAAMVSAWKGRLLPAVQPLLASGAEGLLSPARLEALAAEAGSGSAASAGEVAALKAQLAKASAAHSAATRKAEEASKAARDALDKQKKAFEELEKKHTALVMAHVDMEESVSSLQVQRDDLAKKSEMCSVFESGLVELRTMLEKEIEKGQDTQKAWEDLSKLQKNYKLTWLPDKAATHCMKCECKFSMFGGGSKGHCRYCGRVFCKSCTTTCAIPEFGYNDKVKICKGCNAFRSKALGENAAEAAAAAAAEEEEEAGRPGETVLSYDSDELE